MDGDPPPPDQDKEDDDHIDDDDDHIDVDDDHIDDDNHIDVLPPRRFGEESLLFSAFIRSSSLICCDQISVLLSLIP